VRSSIDGVLVLCETRPCARCHNLGFEVALGFAQLEHHERSPAEHGVQTDNPLQAELVARLRGGGGDGGATGAESRDSYLSMYAEKKPDKVDAGEEKLASFTQCRFLFPPTPALYSASLPTLQVVVGSSYTDRSPTAPAPSPNDVRCFHSNGVGLAAQRRCPTGNGGWKANTGPRDENPGPPNGANVSLSTAMATDGGATQHGNHAHGRALSPPRPTRAG